jgi:hypothetical protein
MRRLNIATCKDNVNDLSVKVCLNFASKVGNCIYSADVLLRKMTFLKKHDEDESKDKGRFLITRSFQFQ